MLPRNILAVLRWFARLPADQQRNTQVTMNHNRLKFTKANFNINVSKVENIILFMDSFHLHIFDPTLRILVGVCNYSLHVSAFYLGHILVLSESLKCKDLISLELTLKYLHRWFVCLFPGQLWYYQCSVIARQSS